MINRLSVLVLREMHRTALYTAGLAVAPLLIVAFLMAAHTLPSLSVAIQRGLSISPAFGVVGALQLVQMTIQKEKAAGGFLFLRMLPISDAEIISGKLLAIMLDVFIICMVPLAVLGSGVLYFHAEFPRYFWVEIGWAYILFVAIAVGMAICAIRFESQRALLVPLFVALVFLGGAALAWVHLPMVARVSVLVGIQDWGIPVAIVLIWLGWRQTIRIFSKQDFVQLSE